MYIAGDILRVGKALLPDRGNPIERRYNMGTKRPAPGGGNSGTTKPPRPPKPPIRGN